MFEIVEVEIETRIEETVKEQVAAKLHEYIPKELQDELAARKLELERVQRALHNSLVSHSFPLRTQSYALVHHSESRRANAELRSGDMDSALHTIYQPNGNISALFP